MTEAGMALPILPGKREALNAFTKALAGPRLSEYEASQISVLRESWFVQQTPHGDLIIVYFEAPDVGAVMAGLAESTEPFDTWFRSQVLEITGVDLSGMTSGLNDCVFQWRRKS